MLVEVIYFFFTFPANPNGDGGKIDVHKLGCFVVFSAALNDEGGFTYLIMGVK